MIYSWSYKIDNYPKIELENPLKILDMDFIVLG